MRIWEQLVNIKHYVVEMRDDEYKRLLNLFKALKSDGTYYDEVQHFLVEFNKVGIGYNENL